MCGGVEKREVNMRERVESDKNEDVVMMGIKG